MANAVAPAQLFDVSRSSDFLDQNG